MVFNFDLIMKILLCALALMFLSMVVMVFVVVIREFLREHKVKKENQKHGKNNAD